MVFLVLVLVSWCFHFLTLLVSGWSTSVDGSLAETDKMGAGYFSDVNVLYEKLHEYQMIKDENLCARRWTAIMNK